jgi:hypothetical protein
MDGIYHEVNGDECFNYKLWDVNGWVNARRLINGDDYGKACELLYENVVNMLKISKDESVLVVGTEEFMYPALYIGAKLEAMGCDVRSHSTTRSPIAVYKEDEYPLHERYKLESVYDKNRVTFLYDIKKYDRVIVVTDSKLSEDGALNSLINAIQQNNDKIDVVRWN